MRKGGGLMIRISGFENCLLNDFSLVKRANCHSECTFKVILPYDSSLSDKINSEISIDNGGEYIFFGYIDEISADNNFAGTVTVFHAVSYSKKSDIKPMKRIFQNPEKTLGSVMNIVSDKGGYKTDCTCGEKFEMPVIQNGETDFRFMVRLSEEKNLRLYVCDSIKSGDIHFIADKYTDKSAADINSVPERLNFLSVCDPKNGENYTVKKITLSGQYIEIGRKVKFGGETGYVVQMRIYMEDFAFHYEYLIYPENRQPEFEMPMLPEYILMKAVTTENDSQSSAHSGMIKVRFECDYDDPEPDCPVWIPYITPYSSERGGIVFMPEKDDTVYVTYSSGTIYASEYFGEKPLDGKFRDFDKKYISLYNKIITFSEEQLEIRSDENTISLTKDSISLNSGDTSVELNSKGITFKVKDCVFKMDEKSARLDTGDSKLNIGSDMTAESNNVKISGSGNISVKSGKEVLISGTKIHLK
ncbi:MAG: hypothetical protein IJ666_07510 [Ruminococcus sp.]|nr:hypothetical protein [Ruminococcus sp.]